MHQWWAAVRATPLLSAALLKGESSSMVNHCSVVGCSNRVGKKEGLSLYRFPLGDRQMQPMGCCSPPLVLETKCSLKNMQGAFYYWQVTGGISTSNNHCGVQENHSGPGYPDYVPSVFPNKKRMTGTVHKQKLRLIERAKEKEKKK